MYVFICSTHAPDTTVVHVARPEYIVAHGACSHSRKLFQHTRLSSENLLRAASLAGSILALR